ncbi:MAG: aminopeptidase P family N-terminal domain-containing protein, partial [Planctomycetota bacterium]
MSESTRSDPHQVVLSACRERQTRLREQMAGLECDLILLTRHESVQWLTGVHVSPLFAPAATLDSDGRVTLVVPRRMLARIRAAADEVVDYEEKWHSTLRDDQRAASDDALTAALPATSARAGGEWSFLSPRLQAAFPEPIVDVEPTLFRLRRRKHDDELRMMRRAI